MKKNNKKQKLKDKAALENYIELKEKTDDQLKHPTTEDYKKFKPREIILFDYHLKNNSEINKYSWEKDGPKLINKDKIYYTNNEKKKLKFLLLRRMPNELRKEFWFIASGAKKEMLNNPCYYNHIINSFPDYIPSPYENQIELDLRRTFPDDPFFKNEKNLDKLKRVLLAYSRRNLSIGYCQGFNFIVGKLLKVVENEEEVFWIFVQLIENILQVDYYSELSGILVDNTIIFNLLFRNLPKLIHHLYDNGYELSLNNIICKWLVSLFIQNISFEMSNVIWDSLFVQGSIIIFKAILAIFNLLKTELMGKTCIEEINTIFEENTRYINDFNYINYYLILKKFEFNYKIIQINRRELDKKITESINNTNRFNLERTKKNKEENKKASFVKNINECYEEWPICIYDNDYKYRIVKYFQFMVHPDKIKIINNYFYPQYFEINQEAEENQGFEISKTFGRPKSKSVKTTSQARTEDSKNNSKTNKRRNCCNSDNSELNFNAASCKFAESNYSELDIYKELLIERRPHFCNFKKHITDSSARISSNSIAPRRSSFTKSIDSADNNQYRSEMTNHFNENVSWHLCNSSGKSATPGSLNSNGSVNNFTSDTRNKVKDLLKSNEGDFMFPKTEANLFMVMNNIKNSELSFPEDIFLRRSGKIKSQYEYEEEILNKFS